MGPSGSGKTTLLNIISGFLEADSGNVTLSGEDVPVSEERKVEIRQHKIGFVFQDFMLVDGLTAEENTLFPQIISQKSSEKMCEKTSFLLNEFNISGIANKYPNEISGGQKQRVAIARALSNEPLLIIADEPTGNLDSKSCADVIGAFMAAQNKMGATIIMVTHDAFTASNATRVLFLADGRIVNDIEKISDTEYFFETILTNMKRMERAVE